METIISLGLSILAAIGALYTYVVHTRRLNSQQKQINDYQLRQLKEEEEEKKKAHIKCTVHRSKGKEYSCINIQNYGKATARNLNMEVGNNNKRSLSLKEPDIFPFSQLEASQNIDVRYYVEFGNFSNCNIIFTWDDDYKKGEKIQQVLSL